MTAARPGSSWYGMNRELRIYARSTCFFFFQAEDGIRDYKVTGVQTCALPISSGGMSMGEAFYRHALQSPHSNSGQPSRVAHYLCQRQAMNLCEAFNLKGPITDRKSVV